MAIEEQDLDLIERYLHGKLVAQELEVFEERLKADQSFAVEVNDYKETMEGIDSYGREQFTNTVSGWEQEIKASAKKNEGKVIPFKNYLSMAATLALLLISGYFLFFYQSAEEQLFAQHFQPYDNITSQRSGDPDAELLNEAMAVYDAGSYDQAIDRLVNYLQSNPGDPTAAFYLGEAYLANDQPEKAEAQYIGLMQQRTHVFGETAEWHLALSYLKQKRSLKLEEVLRSITEEKDHTYYQEATELLEAR